MKEILSLHYIISNSGMYIVMGISASLNIYCCIRPDAWEVWHV